MACPKLTKKTPLNLYESDSERQLVEACMEGNRQAQFQLYKRYSKAMFNICLRMLNSREDAEDLLQNSFVNVYSKMHYYRFESTIGAWIKRIVVNNCINFLKKKRLKLVELGEHHSSKKIEEKESSPISYNVQSIQKAMTQLSDGYRVVFTLYAIEGYDHQEIAQIMDITTSTSKSQYSRAKKRLKEILVKN